MCLFHGRQRLFPQSKGFVKLISDTLEIKLTAYAELGKMCRDIWGIEFQSSDLLKDKHKMIKMTTFNLEILTKPVILPFSEIPLMLMCVLTHFVLMGYQKPSNLREILKEE